MTVTEYPTTQAPENTAAVDHCPDGPAWCAGHVWATLHRFAEDAEHWNTLPQLMLSSEVDMAYLNTAVTQVPGAAPLVELIHNDEPHGPRLTVPEVKALIKNLRLALRMIEKPASE